MPARSIDIVIVNWNAGNQLKDCIASIYATQSKKVYLNRVVVVDNGSTDDSIEGIQGVDSKLRIIRNKRNRGFAAACNQGAADSQTDYLLFLNPDSRLFPNSLITAVEFMEREENQGIGICGIQLVNAEGKIQRSCARAPTPSSILNKALGLDRLLPGKYPSYMMSEWDHGHSREVDHVMGAFFLVRRSVFEKLAGFDERFFVYLEDLDFSVRAKKAGWRSYYLAEAQAYHKGGGTSQQIKATRLFYSLRSRILYGYKHFGLWSGTMLLLVTMLIEPISRLVYVIAKGEFQGVRETVGGYWLLWKYLFSQAWPDLARFRKAE